MKTNYIIRIMLSLLFSAGIRVITEAQKVSLIDVNKIKNSFPRNDELSTKNAFMLFNGYSYFSADDGIHGRELWRTDGTTAGTSLVKDVNPGSPSSDIFDYSLTSSGGKLYFSAYDEINGKELWVSNGTTEGTHLVTDIASGVPGSNPQYLTDVNGTLFFSVSYFDPNFGNINQLWKSDGTAATTVLVKDLPNGYPLQDLVNVNGRLFFVFFDFFTGAELYTSDGTTDGTTITADLNPFGGSFPRHLTSLNGLLYFSADDGSGGKLCVSDGTPAGTHPVSNINNINLPINYDFFSDDNRFRDSFAIVNNVLYFQGSTFFTGNELYRYNTADAGANVELVKDIVAGPDGSFPSFITPVNNNLFFTIGPAGADAQLWKSDGSETGTSLVKDINPGGDNFYYGLTSAYNMLLFAYGNEITGFDLWRSNGTDGGTTIVKDIAPGIYSSFPQYIVVNNGLFLFGASDVVNGFELWKSDGSSAGTVMVKDINQTSSASSDPNNFTAAANNKAIFTAFDDRVGTEVRISDGTDAGTTLLQDIYPGGFSSNPAFYTKLLNQTFFVASDRNGPHLWKSNGTSAGTSIVTIAGLFENFRYISKMVATDNLLYIFTYNYQTGQIELWRTDGTQANSYIIKSDISGFFNINVAAVGTTLFFTNYDDFNGLELWKTSGTAASTGLTKDINPGFYGSYPDNLFNFNGKLFFSAYDGGALGGNTLWTSDGTAAGTKLVKPILVLSTPFAQTNRQMFFYALNEVTKGYELFSTDGSSKGTEIVKDIFPGPTSSNGSSLVSAGSLVYFFADDGVYGHELWKTNGTKQGTQLVKNITEGQNGTFTNWIVSVNDQLFFTLGDALWQSDGTLKGTHQVDAPSLTGVTNVSRLSSIYGNLYFSGYSPGAGQELYVATVPKNSSPLQITRIEPAISDETGAELSAKLLSNPMVDQLAMSVDVKADQQARIIMTDASGRIVATDHRSLAAGTNRLSYNVSAWAKGIYTISIVTNGKYAAQLRAVK
jgi:ELWxxDGT repeat protein